MPTASPTPAFLFAHPAHFIALGFGSGLAPRAPGTVGTLVALPLFSLLQGLGASQAGMLAVTAGLFALGVWACARAGHALGIADHGALVWDEVIAYLLVLVLVVPTPAAWLTGFVLFRFFDIVKPWPIRFFDRRLKNGFGVMFDDLLAAGYSLLILWGMGWLA
jgi:phosphatidylglycerophosphatase A